MKQRLATSGGPAAFVVKAAIEATAASTFHFLAQKTMYGGRRVATGDTIFVFASEHEGGAGLIATGRVLSVRPIPRTRGVHRETPRVDVVVQRLSTARERLGRQELRVFAKWNDGRPETELNFKLYRQATNKLVGISEAAANFLWQHF